MSFARIRPRRGTATQWSTANTILAEGEIGIEVPDEGVGKGTVKIKFGDGVTPWNSLPYGLDLTEIFDNLATKNLKTYTSLEQIGCTVKNTITEVMAKLPSNSVLDMGVSTTESNLTKSLPVVAAGRLVLSKQYSARGIATFTRFSNGTTWINPYMDSTFVGWSLPAAKTLSGLTASIDELNNTSHFMGCETKTYADIPSMVLGVHASLSDQQSVCKNFKYSTNSALVIGNRFSADRGRYLVLPRTNITVYAYQVKDGNAYNTATLATTEELTALSEATKTAQYGTCDSKDLNTLTTAGIYFCSSNLKASLENNFPVATKGYLVVIATAESAVQQIYYANKGAVYIRTYWDSAWSTWQQLAMGSDVPKIQRGSGTVNIVSPTTTPVPTEITFANACASVPTVMLDSEYRHLISAYDVTKTGFKVSGINNEMSSLGSKDFTWVAFE